MRAAIRMGCDNDSEISAANETMLMDVRKAKTIHDGICLFLISSNVNIRFRFGLKIIRFRFRSR